MRFIHLGRMRGRRLRAPSVSSVLALSLLFAAAPAAQAVVIGEGGQPDVAAANPRSGADTSGPGSQTVTLLTGDVVRVRGKGKDLAAQFETPSEDAQIIHAGENVYALPGAARPLLAAGKLDWRLFDLSQLVRDGYTDDQVKALPVIVEYSAAAGGAQAEAATTLAGASVDFRLESIGGVAAQVDRSKAREFFASVTQAQPGAAAESASVRIAPGIEKIWLDGKVQAQDDVSRVTIGADKAWAAGIDGAGVSVAVIDTGIDANHADLAGSVIEAKDFVPAAFPGGDSAADRYGHGTHVASIIAGTGAKSSGKYAGVGPKAKLFNAKVLSDGGSGYDSWIIAGMEWAASKAKIVNMSLGGCCTDGSDPLARALNTISQRTGALFVVSAGNNGTTRTVGTPGVAEAALTVAATTRNGSKVDGYSSRGLRAGDDGLKPDIAAPGTDTWAASANNGDNIICRQAPRVCDSNGYMHISGTSMAAPHVAASAALVLQRHPDWTAQQIKDALTSTAKPTANDPVSAQGAGLVDVGTAVTQSLHATGTLNLGVAKSSPQPGDRLTRTITYTNSGTAPLTLDLTTSTFADAYNSGRTWTPPAGAVRVEPARLSVPAGGTATATITVDASTLPTPAQWGRTDSVAMLGGRVTATGPAGARASTTVNLGRDIARYPLKVTGSLRDGSKPYPNTQILACASTCWVTYPFADDSEWYSKKWFGVSGGSRYDLRPDLPADKVPYRLSGVWLSTDPGKVVSFTGFEVMLDQPRDINLDGRQAQLFDVVTERPTVNDQTLLTLGEVQSFYGPGYPPYLLLGPSAKRLFGATRRVPVPLRLRTDDGERPVTVDALLSRVTWEPGFTWRWQPESRRELPNSGEVTLIDVGDASPPALAGKDLRGKVALVREAPKKQSRLIDDEVAAVAKAGASGVVLAVNDGVPIRYNWRNQPIWATVVTRADGDTLAGLMGNEPLTMRAEADRSYLYDLNVTATLPRPNLTFEFKNKDVAALNATYQVSEPGTADPWTRWGVERTETYPDNGLWLRTGMPLPTRRTEYVSPGYSYHRELLTAFDWGEIRYFWSLNTPSLQAGQTMDLGPNVVPLVPGQHGKQPIITNQYSAVRFNLSRTSSLTIQ